MNTRKLHTSSIRHTVGIAVQDELIYSVFHER